MNEWASKRRDKIHNANAHYTKHHGPVVRADSESLTRSNSNNRRRKKSDKNYRKKAFSYFYSACTARTTVSKRSTHSTQFSRAYFWFCFFTFCCIVSFVAQTTEEKTVNIVASTTSYSAVMKARKNTKEVVTVHRECARERRGVRAKRFFQPIHNQLVSSIEQVLCAVLRVCWYTRARARFSLCMRACVRCGYAVNRDSARSNEGRER